MIGANEDISGYSDSDIRISEDSLDVDFSRAKLLNTTGTICDAYEYRQGTRRVFVKKLKTEFRNSPRHRAALGKEYEIGASLSHPSIATYRYAKDDYIVTDFVDGKTLSSMMQNRDQWLESGDNALKILRELALAVGYLHDRNLVHSDIKGDNVIITSGTHNAVLVDFDKCHSSSLDMVSGSPGLYGVSEDETGNPQIDFNGLARIAEKLAPIVKSPSYKKLLRRFVNACCAPDVTPDKLLSVLQHHRNSNTRTVWLTVSVALIAVLVSIFFVTNPFQPDAESETAIISQDNGTDSTVSGPGATNAVNASMGNPVEIQTPIQGKDNNSVNLKSLNQELEKIYYPLYGQIDMTLAYIREQGGPEALYGEEAMQLMENVNELQQEVWTKGFRLYQSRFPRLEYEEAYQGYTAMPAFPKMVNSVDTINKLLGPVVKAKAPEFRNRSFNYDNM